MLTSRDQNLISRLLQNGLLPMEILLNRYLAADPEKAHELHAYVGKHLHIILLPWECSFYLSILPDHSLQLTASLNVPPTVTLRGTPLALFSLLSHQEGVLPNTVELRGDTSFAQQLSKILRELDIDWEEQLAHYTGDHIATLLTRRWRKFQHWRQHATQSLGRQLKEYFDDEIRIIATRASLEEFYRDVDQVRDEVERLSQRLAILASKE